MDRRTFLQASASASLATAAGSLTGAFDDSARADQAKPDSDGARRIGPNDRIRVAVMGVRGRGSALLTGFADQADVDVRYVADVDQGVLNSRSDGVDKRTGRRVERIKDFRRALDDNQIDALVIGTPDHWHAIPTILACQAGKDVYVEKPDGHNLVEGRRMVAAADKHQRVVQLGTQARSRPAIHEALQFVRTGQLGKVRFAKAWESARQGSIGHPADSEPPAGVDYDFWLGAAPKRPFNPRRFHGDWRWFFDYGTGDLGDDDVHRLDMARWGLETALAKEGRQLPAVPRAVSAHGGKYFYDDAQQWPDTLMVTYDYEGGYVLTYEMRLWSPYRLHDETEGAAVLGEGGYVIFGNGGWRAYDERGKLSKSGSGGNVDGPHIRNFLDCMRSRQKPAADLATVGHPSSLLCHLGNAACRAGRTLRFDPVAGNFVNDKDASQYLTRPEYRKPWVLPEV